MRKKTAIIVGIIVLASCIPWIRRQHFFSVLVGLIAVALFAYLVFGGARAVGRWWRDRRLQEQATRIGRMRRMLPRMLAFLIFSLILALIVPHYFITSTEVYKLAVTTAHGETTFNEALGVPVHEGWFSEGNIHSGDSGTASLKIPVCGSIQKGNLRVIAIKENGNWRLKDLTLELAKSGRSIDLLKKEAGGPGISRPVGAPRWRPVFGR